MFLMNAHTTFKISVLVLKTAQFLKPILHGKFNEKNVSSVFENDFTWKTTVLCTSLESPFTLA